jgi:AraC family transcriptional regulator, L-rhamnose operon transcriptional activator RhaR
MNKNSTLRRLHGNELFSGDTLRLKVARYVVTDSNFPHDHDFMEMVLVTGGSGGHESPLGQQTLRAGDVLVLRPGAWHAYHDCKNLVVYNCCFAPDLLEGELAFLKRDAATNYLLFSGPLAPERRGLLSFQVEKTALQQGETHLEALCELQNQAHSNIARMGQLLCLFAVLSQSLDVEHNAPARTPHPQAQQALQMLEEELSRAWTLDELARRVHLHPGYLSRVFKVATGLAPLEYLARRRAERAAQLLLRTQWPIAKIGEEVGWDDPNYFARRFRAAFGISASEYRRRFG